MSSIRVFNRAISQIRQSNLNLEKLKQARREHETAMEDLDFKRRESELRIEKMEREGALDDEQLEFTRNMNELMQDKSEKELESFDLMIENEEKKNTKALKSGVLEAKAAVKSDPSIVDIIKSEFMPNPNYAAGSGERPYIRRPKSEKSSSDVTAKDIADMQVRLWKEDGAPDDKRPADYLKEAKELLMPSGVPAMRESTNPLDSYKNGGSKTTSNNGKIKVRTPDGRTGYISEDKLEDAKKRGFTVL